MKPATIPFGYAYFKPVLGMSQTSDGENSRLSPTKTTLMLLHKLFMDTEKLLPRVGANPGIIGYGGGIYGECGAPAYIGDLGASPPGVSSGKAPGGVRVRCPLKLTNYQQFRH